jgi:hypothetical protein
MAFDISTAKPVEEPAATSGGFDLSTAEPVNGAVSEDYDPTKGMSTYEKVAAGAGKAIVDLGRGVGQRLGMVSEEDVAEARKLDEPLMRTKEGVAGNIAGNVAAAIPIAMAAPVTGTVAGSMALGGAFGAAQPTVKGESVGKNVAEGAAFGLGGALAPRALARVVNPKAAERQAEALGKLTPGQALGGAWKKTEEKATSLPLAGPSIAKAQRESVESWNKGVLNKVLEPIGQKTDKFGHAGVEEASQKLSQAYENLLPKLKIQVDDTFDAEIKNLSQMTSSLRKDEQDQFEKILGPNGLGKMITQHGKMSGESMKSIDSELGRLSRGYSKSPDFNQQQLGDALREAQASLRSLVERSNPDHAKELKNINSGWARLVRVENAAGKTGAKEGVFTPAQLNQAVRATDESLRHKKFAHGKALFQDIATQAEKTIGNTYPDSGSAGRAALGALGYYAVNPKLAVGEGAIAGVYGLPGVRHALSSAFTKRPASARKMAEAIKRKAGAGGKVGAVAGEAYLNEENK